MALALLRAIAGESFELKNFSGGKSGLHRAMCRLTAGLGRLKRLGRKVPQKMYRFFGFG